MLRITCPRCSGFDPACGRCGGSGEAGVLRCPSSHSSRELAEAFFAFDLIESGTWPVDGGLCAQSASFLAFVRAVNAERAAIDRANDSSKRK